MNKMKPCPCCGDEKVRAVTDKAIFLDYISEAFGDESYVMEIIEDDYMDDVNNNLYGFRVRCFSCYTLGSWASTKEEAIERWNERVTDKVTLLRRDGTISVVKQDIFFKKEI